MIDELEVKKYDELFGTNSKIYQVSNTIIINTPLDEWRIVVTDWGEKEKGLIDLTLRPYKKVTLYHKNKFGRKNKYHIQSHKGTLVAAFHSIYCHKKWMFMVNKSSNTYNKGCIK